LKEYNSYLFAEVPEDAVYGMFFIHNGSLYTNMIYKKKLFNKRLPFGNYEIIGLAKELDWKDWVIIVDKENDGSGLNGWWYKYYGQDADIWTKNPTKSGLSLVKFLGMEDKNVLVLKKAV
jgi:hypothetical protein